MGGRCDDREAGARPLEAGMALRRHVPSRRHGIQPVDSLDSLPAFSRAPSCVGLDGFGALAGEEAGMPAPTPETREVFHGDELACGALARDEAAGRNAVASAAGNSAGGRLLEGRVSFTDLPSFVERASARAAERGGGRASSEGTAAASQPSASAEQQAPVGCDSTEGCDIGCGGAGGGGSRRDSSCGSLGGLQRGSPPGSQRHTPVHTPTGTPAWKRRLLQSPLLARRAPTASPAMPLILRWRTRLCLLHMYAVLSMLLSLTALITSLHDTERSKPAPLDGIQLVVTLVDRMAIFSHAIILAMLFGLTREVSGPIAQGLGRCVRYLLVGSAEEELTAFPRALSGFGW